MPENHSRVAARQQRIEAFNSSLPLHGPNDPGRPVEMLTSAETPPPVDTGLGRASEILVSECGEQLPNCES